MKWLKLMCVGYTDRDAAGVKRRRCAQQQEQEAATQGANHGWVLNRHGASLGRACDTAAMDGLYQDRRYVMARCQAAFFISETRA